MVEVDVITKRELESSGTLLVPLTKRAVALDAFQSVTGVGGNFVDLGAAKQIDELVNMQMSKASVQSSEFRLCVVRVNVFVPL